MRTTAAPVLALAAVLLAACGSDPAPPGDGGPDPRRDRLERMAREAPADLVADVERALAATPARVEVVPGAGEPGWTLLTGPGAWRVDLADDAGDGAASLLARDGEVCLDEEYRPRLSTLVAAGAGAVAFDPAPWTCTPAGFGLNRLATFPYPRHDPRARIAALTTDDPAVWSAAVEDLDGESRLHVRTTGVTEDGVLDPDRPAYDLWLDDEHRPVRMASAGERWDLTYPDGAGDALAAPAEAERGSYGYDLGPGNAVATACRQSGRCDDVRRSLTWGDGRRG